MSRIRLLEDDELDHDAREQVRALEAAGGDTSVIRGLAHRQKLFDAFFRFYSAARQGDAVEAELIELVRLKIARLNNCFT